jgi:hypothetical protein
MQTRIAEGIVTALAPQIDAAEAARMRRAPPADLGAFGKAQAAWAVVSVGEMAFDTGAARPRRGPGAGGAGHRPRPAASPGGCWPRCSGGMPTTAPR